MIQYLRHAARLDSDTPMYRRIALGILLVLFAMNVYRAATQSITTDEAYAHNLFLTGFWQQVFDSYDACHHVLHTILCKLSIQLFGLSEFTLRIPSLLGGLLLLVTIYRLARHVFGEGLQLLLAVALASLNPLVLDYMSAARGYGMGLALFLWALYQVLLYTGGDARTSRIYRAGIGLGLAVAANLTLLVPGTALALIFLLFLVRERRLAESIDAFIVPGIVTAFVIVILPLTKAHRDSFYVGVPVLADTLKNLVAFSLYHHPLSDRLFALLPPPEFWYAAYAYLIAPAILAAAAVAFLLILLRWWRQRGFTGLDAPSRFLLTGGGTLVLAIPLLVALHETLNVAYPASRTGLYLIPLFTLVALALPASLSGRRPAFLVAGLPIWLVGLVSLAHYLVHLQVNHYGEWRFEADTEKIVGLIRERHEQRPAARVRVGNSWLYEPSLNFYRRRYGLTWMEPPTRQGPDGDYDFYVLLDEDATLIKKRGLRVLYSDRFAGVSLAEPGALPPP